MHNPIEFAAGLCTADNNDRPTARSHPLSDIALGFGIIGIVFVAVTVAGWAVVQIARGVGLVS